MHLSSKGHQDPGLYKQEYNSTPRKVIIPFYSALPSRYLEYRDQFWPSQCERGIVKLEQVQQRATNTVRGARNTPPWSFLQRHIVGGQLTVVTNWRKRGSDCLQGRNFSWNKMKRVAERGCAVSSFGGFQDQTGKTLSNVVWSQSWSCSEQEVAMRHPEVPPSLIPWLTIIASLLWTSSSPNIPFLEILGWRSRGEEKLELCKVFHILAHHSSIKDTVFVLFSILFLRVLRLDLVFLTPIEH